VVEGGSHLFAREYCLRYRLAARQPQDRDSSTTQMGFRCTQDIQKTLITGEPLPHGAYKPISGRPYRHP
jgi:hypothetical protein